MHRSHALSALVLALVACAPEGVACGEGAIVGGADREQYLGLDDGQLGAIARIDGTLPAGADVCSGVRVAPGRVLTAGHCAALVRASDARLTLDGRTVAILGVEEHPALDLALVRVADEGGVVLPPIAALGDPIGARLEAAGWGRTDRLQSGALHFVVQPVTSTTSDLVTVDGAGQAGVCGGDSGGPLLTRDVDGAVRVVGVLSTGSITCRDFGDFVRLDAVRDWLVERGALGDASDGCGSIGAAGRCLPVVASAVRTVWCDDGRLRAEDCATCAWDDALSRYACVAAASSACGRLDDRGACDGTLVRRCDRGTLRETECASCARECGIDPGSDHARCR